MFKDKVRLNSELTAHDSVHTRQRKQSVKYLSRTSILIVVVLCATLLSDNLIILEPESSLVIPGRVAKFKQKAANFLMNGPYQLVRAAHASEDEERDAIADLLYGQGAFMAGAAPDAVTNTTLFQANDLFVFDTGQLFVADSAHHRVLGWNSVDEYEIGTPADIVLGQPDFETADAPNPPTDASMSSPMGITMGFDGILYISDTGNNRVLVFVPWNICHFYEYYDDSWCIEEEGFDFSEPFSPFFTDNMEADYALGQADMTTGDAQETALNTLNHPMGLVTDANDNLVVADQGNNRVLIFAWPFETGKDAAWLVGQEFTVESNDNFMLNAAPNPPSKMSMNAPSGVAIGTTANELYVADTGNNRILVFNDNPIDAVADEAIGQPDFTTNIASSTVSDTTLHGPTGLKMDAGNRLFVADTQNHRVLVFDRAEGVSQAVDGVADFVFGQPDFTSNTANNDGVTESALSAPTGVATDAIFMDVYIADSGNHRVLHYWQPLDNPAPAISELDPGTIRAGSDGFMIEVWGSGIIAETTIAINGVTREPEQYFLGTIDVGIEASELITTGQLTITLSNPPPGGGSSSFVLDVIESTVGDDQGDSVIGQAGFTTDNGGFAKLAANTLSEPSGVVIDPNSGRIFVADTNNGRILSWPTESGWLDGQNADLVIGQPDFKTWLLTINSVNNIASPVGLALDSVGNLYVADPFMHRIQIYAVPFSNGMSAVLTIDELNNPLDVILDENDNLYVADSANHRVLFYEAPLASGNIEPDRIYGQADLTGVEANRGGEVTADTLNGPIGVALDVDGNLYISDSSNHRVLLYRAGSDGDTTADVVFGQGGSFTTGIVNKGGLSANSLHFPYGLAFNGQGTLFVADADNNRVLGYLMPSSSDQTADIVYGQNGSFGTSQANRGMASAQRDRAMLDGPLDIGVTLDNDLFIVDHGNNRVMGFRTDEIHGPTTDTLDVYLPLINR